MALFWPVTILACTISLVAWWLYRIDRNLISLPPEVLKLSGEPWTDEQIQSAWNKFERDGHDFTKYLPPRQNRRYVVVGGSGLVGGWIVEHLIMRGEDPAAIRIADLAAPRRELAVARKAAWVKTDIRDPSSVNAVFSQPWPPKVANLPLTVFHTAAFIHAGHGSVASLPPYIKINIEGTQNVLHAAKAAGCDTFIATSSVAVALKRQSFFAISRAWDRSPDGFIQLPGNAEAKDYDAPLDAFPGSYAYSKAKAEKLVREADDKRNRFRTGVIRPGHSIYGHGDQNPHSLATTYLLRGGGVTWLSTFTLQLVSAQNVSLAHLLYESRIHSHDLGGRGYAVCDPGPPLRYSSLERFLSLTTHPSTPISWRRSPPVPFMLLAYPVSWYVAAQRDWLPRLLPKLPADLEILQPAVFNCANLHVVYDDSDARMDLAYRPGHGTLEGLYLVVKEWNQKAEARVAAAKGITS
ncbi:uncharacterized protein A1O9_02641 [Exophiala aquamarina CBS 119918]|uniref:NAD-dependent epimerase/dehydratase domain-containing protein n=1 Tax=Exophiala aquamarina CBS 119918 TaxID=1182545 RepID=A0A072PMG9_9EURO|nr:uncharacterized protein A1O9_02641 [Exophiala aquamarina CBS 119918]KEF61076.1 hypothetical protein A1O9_02641 [Exophiala aquamarina CBS 119918]